MTSTQEIQMNKIQTPIQQIDIKSEHQTQQKQSIQLVRQPSVNQPFIAQSLPSNNVNVNVNTNMNNTNVNMDQMAPVGGAVDENLSSVGPHAQSTSYNQKTYERMRQDEGKLDISHNKPIEYIYIYLLNGFLSLSFFETVQCLIVWQPYRPFCMRIQIIRSLKSTIPIGMNVVNKF